ncbi:hypothetical protein C8J57DRAFT_1483045 [Mycena rebaudengoi]|nr:hypothetical protein C8J57DRAFT_1483045 [Mycena rebaudengoi]
MHPTTALLQAPLLTLLVLLGLLPAQSIFTACSVSLCTPLLLSPLYRLFLHRYFLRTATGLLPLQQKQHFTWKPTAVPFLLERHRQMHASPPDACISMSFFHVCAAVMSPNACARPRNVSPIRAVHIHADRERDPIERERPDRYLREREKERERSAAPAPKKGTRDEVYAGGVPRNIRVQFTDARSAVPRAAVRCLKLVRVWDYMIVT